MATFKIKKNKETVEVEVEVTAAPKGLRNRNKQSVNKRDVEKHLRESGIEVGICLSATSVSNMGSDPQTSGTFIFASKDAPKPELKPELKPEPELKKPATPFYKEVTKVSRKRKQVKSEEPTEQ
tara:strand:+ start:365 stop:736 length:372 start_codon:yes stop_codon:yes gene_type:complete